MELLFGGVPGRPRGDGLDGHAWWPLFRATPIEYIENYYPVLVERYRPIKDSGGAGLHRGGAGIEKVYHVLEAGKVSIHDDREIVPPWGINGGQVWRHLEQVADQGRQRQARAHPVKDRQSRGQCRRSDRVQDRRIRRLGRSARPRGGEGGARRALRSGLAEKADSDYGVVLTKDNKVNTEATQNRRKARRDERGEPEPFNFGYQPPMREAAE